MLSILTFSPFQRFWQDLRYGAKTLVRNPGFSVIAVVSLALGIGATTAIFSICDAIWLQPLPYPDADRLVAVLEARTDRPGELSAVSRPTFFDWRAQSHTFEQFTIVHFSWPYILIGEQQAHQLEGRRISEGYLQMLGAKPCLGRLLTPDNFVEGAEPAVVLSHGVWQRVFGSDPDIAGKSINLEGNPHLVAGVMCPRFQPLLFETDLWTQISPGQNNRVGRYFPTVAHLQKGQTIQTAQAENEDLGFNTDRLLTLTVRLPRLQYIDGSGEKPKMKPEAPLALRRIDAGLRKLSGVVRVAMSATIGSRILNVGTAPPSKEAGSEPPWVTYQPVSADYLQTLEVPLRKGRFFSAADRAGSAPVAIINETAARRFFPEEDPIGKLVTTAQWDNPDIEVRQVVGVVRDVRQAIGREPFPGMYVPYEQLPSQFRWPHSTERTNTSFSIRCATECAAVQTALDRVVADAASDIPVISGRSIAEERAMSTSWSRFYTSLLAAFAGIALVLAMVGVFGVMSYSVARRTREIGIRMALGANPRSVLLMVMRQGVVMTTVGLGIGVGGALCLTRLLNNQLYEVEATDPLTFTAVTVLLAVIAILACLLPARRAARVNPMTALRNE